MSFVSVIIPVFNAERLLPETLESVLKQSHQDFEVIVVDDGSTDESQRICSQILGARGTVISQVNRGSSAARGRGLKRATGKYIAFLDADDTWRSSFLTKHLALLEANADVGASYCFSEFLDRNGAALGIYQACPILEPNLADFYREFPPGNFSSLVFRHEALTGKPEMGPPVSLDEDVHYGEDFDICCRLLAKTKWRILCLPEPLTGYRLHTESKTGTRPYHPGAAPGELHLRTTNLDTDSLEPLSAQSNASFIWHKARVLYFRRDPVMSLRLVWAALRTAPGALNFQRLGLAAAACLQLLLPRFLFRPIERAGFAFYGSAQRRRFQKLQQEFRVLHGELWGQESRTNEGKDTPAASER